MTYEVIPLANTEEQVLRHVPRDVRLTVTCTRNRGLEATLELCERLASQGYSVSPHLVARLFVDDDHLTEVLDRLRASKITSIFVVAGDITTPVGSFAGAPELLRAISASGHEFAQVGVGGYPEGHPQISDPDLWAAMSAKAEFATYVVSQICFDPGRTFEWAREMERRDIGLPVYVGIPGPINRQKLIRVSAGLGLGESARFLFKQQRFLKRYLVSRQVSTKRLVNALEQAISEPNSNLVGLHVFTFNNLKETEEWRRRLLGEGPHWFLP